MAVRHNQRLMRLYRTLHDQRDGRKANPFRELWWNLRKAYFYRWLERRWGGFIDLRAEIGEDLGFLHGPFSVFIANGAKIGNRVTIGHKVTIGVGTDWNRPGQIAPIIGDDVFIGVGASIIGWCNIGNGAKIGAGVVLVNADVEPGAVVVNMGACNLTTGKWVHAERRPRVSTQPAV